ncbi:MAG: trypsin-like peptidase domain-containing protein [Polyangiaceae bacterium]|nr:trypsin-like peptidase domain-containing protein [Polyangiaceae bacterium]
MSTLYRVLLPALTSAAVSGALVLGCPARKESPSAWAQGSAAPNASAAAPLPAPAPGPADTSGLMQPGALTEEERNTIAVFRTVAPSTVFVTQKRVVVDYFAGTSEEIASGSGSGFIWDDQGHIVTNYHVIQGAQALEVTLQDQQSFEARVVGAEPRKDIAVLKIEAPRAALKPVRVPRSGQLVEVGQKAIAIGNPFGLDHTLTKGTISALGRKVQGVGGVTIRDMIQTDAAINPGNSGGPLLDSAGQLIGMNTMIFSRSGSSAGIGFAVPVSTIARVVPQIIRTGRAEQVGMGIEIDPAQRLERRAGVQGVIVLGVSAGSPAEKAGLQGVRQTRRGIQLGDVIVGVDDKPVASYDDLYNGLDGHKPGDRVNIKLRRGNQVVASSLELIALP